MLARLLILVAFFGSIMASSSATDLPDQAAILPTSEGPKIIEQCSRADPTDVSGFWSPAVADVATLERRLPQLLRTSGHKIDLSKSHRQYIGIVSRGKKLIYLNAFSDTIFTAPEYRTSWKRRAIVVCDGGDVFWGVEFDPAANRFAHLEFNGGI